MGVIYEISRNKCDDEKLRKDAIKIYEYIVNNFKFCINQTEIEFDCNEIEYAVLNHNGILILDNFSISVTVNAFLSTLKDYFSDSFSCAFKRANLFVYFINYLIENGLVL